MNCGGLRSPSDLAMPWRRKVRATGDAAASVRLRLHELVAEDEVVRPLQSSAAPRSAVRLVLLHLREPVHGIAQRLSEKWRHFACTSVVITFCTSLFCVGVKMGDLKGKVSHAIVR